MVTANEYLPTRASFRVVSFIVPPIGYYLLRITYLDDIIHNHNFIIPNILINQKLIKKPAPVLTVKPIT